MQHKKRQVDPCHALHNMKESLNPLSRGEPSNPNNDSADTNTVIGFGSSLAWMDRVFVSIILSLRQEIYAMTCDVRINSF